MWARGFADGSFNFKSRALISTRATSLVCANFLLIITHKERKKERDSLHFTLSVQFDSYFIRLNCRNVIQILGNPVFSFISKRINFESQWHLRYSKVSLILHIIYVLIYILNVYVKNVILFNRRRRELNGLSRLRKCVSLPFPNWTPVVVDCVLSQERASHSTNTKYSNRLG